MSDSPRESFQKWCCDDNALGKPCECPYTTVSRAQLAEIMGLLYA